MIDEAVLLVGKKCKEVETFFFEATLGKLALDLRKETGRGGEWNLSF